MHNMCCFVEYLEKDKSEISYSKTCVKQPLLKRPKTGISAILLTFIKLQFIIKIFVLSIFKWPFYTGFTVSAILSWF